LSWYDPVDLVGPKATRIIIKKIKNKIKKNVIKKIRSGWKIWWAESKKKEKGGASMFI
jgi:hypothetical protein